MDGRIDEIFVRNHKVGSQSDAIATDAAVAASLALQHECSFDALRSSLLRDMRGRATNLATIQTDDGWGDAAAENAERVIKARRLSSVAGAGRRAKKVSAPR